VGESKMVSSEVGTAIDMLEILIVNYHEIDWYITQIFAVMPLDFLFQFDYYTR
jgi:hypothetical protein